MHTDNRPLSPHLQIYRLPLTAITSISHRISGALLAVGALVLVYWLAALAGGRESFAAAQAFVGNWFIQLLMFVWTYLLFYHLCNGIRHLVWDAGYGFELETAKKTGVAAIVAAGVLTLLAWIVAWSA
ncbi:succinate dehydrogenase, cytochrome b556 subunit [Arhodomonas sp. AD133]|uniref:succinate dehydrogenase, cytochrome b556 subunit n=1 Tax=Arhodomonas sp. AD133 TaxID=3415009 RepID=UPI003EB8D8E7